MPNARHDIVANGDAVAFEAGAERLQAVEARSARVIGARHEGAAAHMAEAWSRVRREPGVAIVTGGPGHLNALGAIGTAAASDIPVLFLSGASAQSEGGLGAMQETDQVGTARPLCKWACRQIRSWRP